MSAHGVDEGWSWVDKPEILPEAEALIRSGWADRVAIAFAQTPDWWGHADDLAQEARIVMWRSASTFNGFGSVVARCKQEGRWRIINIVRGDKNMTGQPRKEIRKNVKEDAALDEMRLAIQQFRQTEHRDPSAAELGVLLGIPRTTAIGRMKNLHRATPDQVKQASNTSLEALTDLLGFEFVIAEDQIDAATLAYHHGQILTAMNDLPPKWREYLYLRFWEGKTDAEIEKETGMTPKRFRDKALDRLAAPLAHLADL